MLKNKKASRILALVAILTIGVLLPIHAASAGNETVAGAAGSTLGWAGMAIGGLALGAALGCVPCGAIAIGLTIGAGFLTWVTTPPHQLQSRTYIQPYLRS